MNLPYKLFLSLSLFLTSFHLGMGQEICTGSQGDNIFLEGDFGSGTANLIPTNPGYAPGFTYTTNVAFDDGFYTITNNSALWPNNFGTWLDIQDNSDDPLGYMMVVNANFSPGKFYEQEVDGLCENTTYNFTADVINFIRIGVGNHILPDVSFVLDGDVKFSSGQIPQDEKWHTYGFSFITGPGQTSVTLTLQNNAPGGIGNDLAIDNISFRPCGPNAIASTDLDGKVCQDAVENISIIADIDGVGVNAFFQWQVSTDNGDTWTDIPGAMDNSYQITNFSAGNYLYRYIFAASEASLQNSKCRTFSTPQALEVVPLQYSIRDTICTGITYQFGTSTLSEPGVYVDSLISAIGCDSVVTLFLETVPDQLPASNTGGQDPSCFGFSDGSISLNSIENVYLPLQFVTINNDIIEEPYTVENLPAGEYLFAFIDHFGCSGMGSIQLEDPPLFTAIGQQDTTIRLGQSFEAATLFSYLPESINWTPENGLSCTDCLSPTIQGILDNTYLGIGFNENQCTDTFRINVRVDASSVIFMPNVFSPNGDGINDFFNVFALDGSVSKVQEIQIWDRWGGFIYSGNNFTANAKNEGWNGEVDGGLVNPGVYTYLTTIELINGAFVQMSGTVTVIR